MSKRLPHPKDLPPASRETRRRTLEALGYMREGLSLRRAARKAHTTPKSMRKFLGSAIHKAKAGRYKAKAWDRLTREMWLYTPEGRVPLEVRDSRSASRIGRYMAAVAAFLKTGDEGPLQAFRRKVVVVGRVGHPFLTDPLVLERLAAAGEVSLETLYIP
jgi:hypothetical protein